MKKKILALVLCAAVVIGLVPAMVTAAYTEGAELTITCNGEAVSSVALHEGEEAVLTALYDGEVTEDDAYQWQKIQDGVPVDLHDETGDQLVVTSDMLCGETAFRCLIIWADGNVTESKEFYVTLAEAEAEEEPEESEAPGTVFEDSTAISLGDGNTADTNENENNEDPTVDEPEENTELEDETSDLSHSDICADNCPGMDFCDCGCHLYDRLMNCDDVDEMNETLNSVMNEQFAFITEEQWDDIDMHMVELIMASEEQTESEPPEEDENPEVESEIAYVTVNFTDVAPLGDPVVG